MQPMVRSWVNVTTPPSEFSIIQSRKLLTRLWLWLLWFGNMRFICLFPYNDGQFIHFERMWQKPPIDCWMCKTKNHWHSMNSHIDHIETAFVHSIPAAKCKSVLKRHANLPDTPVDLTSVLSTSRCSQAPLELTNVLSDSASAFSSAPESSCGDGGAFWMLGYLAYWMVKVRSSWDLCDTLCSSAGDLVP